MPIVLKSGSLNLLEPSGPVQTCNGIALPFILTENEIKCMRYSLSVSVDVLVRPELSNVWAFDDGLQLVFS
jgi:hypothetical protein